MLGREDGTLSGRVLLYDALRMRFHEVRRDAHVGACVLFTGGAPSLAYSPYDDIRRAVRTSVCATRPLHGAPQVRLSRRPGAPQVSSLVDYEGSSWDDPNARDPFRESARVTRVDVTRDVIACLSSEGAALYAISLVMLFLCAALLLRPLPRASPRFSRTLFA